jgi:hypothetical protein
VSRYRVLAVASLGALVCFAGAPLSVGAAPTPRPTPTPKAAGGPQAKQLPGKKQVKKASAPKVRRSQGSLEPGPLKLRPGQFALPGAAPRYDQKGRYLPTIYIYQETNGEFRILGAAESKAPPAAVGDKAAPGQMAAPAAAPPQQAAPAVPNVQQAPAAQPGGPNAPGGAALEGNQSEAGGGGNSAGAGDSREP